MILTTTNPISYPCPRLIMKSICNLKISPLLAPSISEVPRGDWHTQAGLTTTVTLQQLPWFSLLLSHSGCPLLNTLHGSTLGFHCLMVFIPPKCQCLQRCCPRPQRHHFSSYNMEHSKKRLEKSSLYPTVMICFLIDFNKLPRPHKPMSIQENSLKI